MKAITVRQPHAAAIIHGPKRIENRDWFCKHRGLLAIHAGKSRESLDELTDEQLEAWPEFDPASLVFGAVIGVVTMNGCERYENQGRWACGKYCFILTNPIALPEPIPWAGALGLFDVPRELIGRQLPDLVEPQLATPVWRRTR